jgi:hypothetical protein
VLWGYKCKFLPITLAEFAHVSTREYSEEKAVACHYFTARLMMEIDDAFTGKMFLGLVYQKAISTT